MIKITIVGAGSIVFSAHLLSDLTLNENLRKSNADIFLFDINTERLNAVYQLAMQLVKARGAKINVYKADSRKEALQSADFVINTAFVPGYKRMEIERQVAEKHGYYRGIGERVSDYYGTIGAYHQLQFFLDLAKSIMEYCPHAWLLQSANPVFEGCTLLGRFTECKVVGMCHGYAKVKEIVDALGVEYEAVHFQVAGFNHCIWLTKFLVAGGDGYAMIEQWFREKALEWWSSEEYMFDARRYQLSPAAFAMYKLYGLFPIGDTVRSVSPWWFNIDLKTKQKWFPAGGMDSEIGWLCRLSRNMDQLQVYLDVGQGKREVMQAVPTQMSGEPHIPFIDSVVNNRPARLVLNIPNKNVIKEIPSDVFIETHCQILGDRITPEEVPPLPRRLIFYILIPRWLQMERVLGNFVDRDRGGLILSVLEDRRTSSLEEAEQVVDELLKLPWNEEAAQHYRRPLYEWMPQMGDML
ncbi:MAG: hypothetical protein QXI12_08195 [Candidatus Methanomethyliaceae archaeon]